MIFSETFPVTVVIESFEDQLQGSAWLVGRSGSPELLFLERLALPDPADAVIPICKWIQQFSRKFPGSKKGCRIVWSLPRPWVMMATAKSSVAMARPWPRRLRLATLPAPA